MQAKAASHKAAPPEHCHLVPSQVAGGRELGVHKALPARGQGEREGWRGGRRSAAEAVLLARRGGKRPGHSTRPAAQPSGPLTARGWQPQSPPGLAAHRDARAEEGQRGNLHRPLPAARAQALRLHIFASPGASGRRRRRRGRRRQGRGPGARLPAISRHEPLVSRDVACRGGVLLPLLELHGSIKVQAVAIFRHAVPPLRVPAASRGGRGSGARLGAGGGNAELAPARSSLALTHSCQSRRHRCTNLPPSSCEVRGQGRTSAWQLHPSATRRAQQAAAGRMHLCPSPASQHRHPHPSRQAALEAA